MRLLKLFLVCAIAAALAGCGAKPPASVKGGECKAFTRAATEICGLTELDQAAIDDYIEAGVAGCRWRRPQARTPSCADLRAEVEDLRKETARPAPPPPAKPTLLERIKSRFKKKPAAK